MMLARSQTRCATKLGKKTNFNGGGPRSSKAVERSPSRDPHKVAFKAIGRAARDRAVTKGYIFAN